VFIIFGKKDKRIFGLVLRVAALKRQDFAFAFIAKNIINFI